MKEEILELIERAIVALKEAKLEVEGGATGEIESLCLASIRAEAAYTKACEMEER